MTLRWYRIFYNSTDEGMGITHVIHTTLQPDTHHPRALTHSLQRRSQLNLRDMITLDLLPVSYTHLTLPTKRIV